MQLKCPLCDEMLEFTKRTYRCPQGHSFDVARQGYVHLLPVQQKHSLNPGDTRQQVLSRRRFLEAGFYKPVLDAATALLQSENAQGLLLDVGCGEGYYTARMADALGGELLGLDISKEAVRCAAAAYKTGVWVCGTAAHLPVADHTVGVLTSLFSVTLPEEFHRVLEKDGLFLQVLAAQDHLLGLKSLIYPELKFKEKNSSPELPGFRKLQSVPVRFTFRTEGEQVMDLLAMTPHIYRIGKEGLDRIQKCNTLTDTASCVINLYSVDG